MLSNKAFRSKIPKKPVEILDFLPITTAQVHSGIPRQRHIACQILICELELRRLYMYLTAIQRQSQVHGQTVWEKMALEEAWFDLFPKFEALRARRNILRIDYNQLHRAFYPNQGMDQAQP